MKSLIYLALFCLVLLPVQVQAQDRVMIVELSDRLGEQLSREYSPSREQAWCVTEYQSIDKEDHVRIHVTALDAYRSGREHSVEVDNSEACRDAAGHPQPMLHSHPAGSCQASPRDLVVYLRREALFDGILCGPRVTVWYFASVLRNGLPGAASVTAIH